MKFFSHYCLLLFFALLIFTNPKNAAAQSESFFCDGAIAFSALFTPNGESVLLEFQGQIKVVLKQAVSASGSRYEGGGYELHGKGGDWILTRPGSAAVSCAIASQTQPVQAAPPPASLPPVTPPPVTTPTVTTLPVQAGVQIQFPYPAHSFGGTVRSGPSMKSRRIGSLDEGNHITLLENTGQRMGEHDWFKIRFHGRTGYQWGGILCTNDVKAIGVLSVCPSFKGVSPPPKSTTRTSCRKGQYWSRSRKKCRWYAKKKKKKSGCPPGTVWTNEGNFCQDKWAAFCGPGYHYNKSLKKCQQNH